MRDLKLRYFLELVSNVGAKAQTEAQALEQAHRRINKAVSESSGKVLGLDKAVSSAGSNRAMDRQVDAQRQLQQQLGTTTAKVADLDRAITRAGANSSMQRQAEHMNRLASRVDDYQARQARARAAANLVLDKGPEAMAAAAAGFYGGQRLMAPPIRAYSSLEEATQDLRIAMTDASGSVSKDFEKISVEAVKLGNQLPGATKDFMSAARALIEQGTPTDVVANGGLRAASYFGALMKMDQYQSAETIAKVREAYGLKDGELVDMADLMQRGRYAFGLNPQDYRMVASYAAPTYNTLGLTGLDNAKKLLAVQGIAAQVGLESSSFGTNFSMMLQRIGQFDSRVNKNSKEAREVRDLLGEHGIDMQFYGADGRFAGIENMLQQLAKLQPLNQADQQKVLTRLFGAEAGRPAQILVQKGMEEYQKALAKLDAQASLDTRINMKMETFASKLESLTGTIENAMAAIGKQTGQFLKGPMDAANNVIGGPVKDFMDRYPGVGTVGLLGAGAAGGWLGYRAARAGLGLLGGLRGGAAAPAAAKVVEDKAFAALAKDVAEQAAKVAGGPASAAAAGGAAAAGAGASGASVAAGGLRSYVARLGVLGTALGLGMDLFGTSDEEIAVLKEAERQRRGYRGQGFNDPRRLDAVTVSAPDMPAQPVAAGGITELKVGQGSLEITLHLDDQRVWATQSVLQQPNLIRLNPGATNPGGLR